MFTVINRERIELGVIYITDEKENVSVTISNDLEVAPIIRSHLTKVYDIIINMNIRDKKLKPLVINVFENCTAHIIKYCDAFTAYKKDTLRFHMNITHETRRDLAS